MTPLIRPAMLVDLPVINSIYNHYVLECTCTYQTVPSTAEERVRWFERHDEKHPVIIAEQDGKIVGWGSLSRLHERQAFEHSVEDSIYVHPEFLGQGIGKVLLAELLKLAKELGHHTVLGAISGDQAPSIALHEAFGFQHVARFTQVGRKFDRWLDVVWLQIML